jgi:nitroimidazol reductase NimA-like FMN-containing flavoprotein (pyridoxamine 5'-phosphate oxidase superfamily)
MIRSDQTLSDSEISEILNRGTNGILALSGADGYPYGVPMSYVYYNQIIYFHCAKVGYKMELMETNPKVCFTVVDQDQIVGSEFTTYYRSVIAFGNIRMTGEKEKEEAFLAFCAKYAGDMPLAERQAKVAGCENALIIAIDIAQITGKQAVELMNRKPPE